MTSQPSYNQYEESGASTENRPELIFTPYSTVEASLSSTFGTSSEYGQSLGITFDDVEVVDGCLYVDADKQKFKLFSWQGANDMSPVERLNRDEDPSADDASDFIRKTYAGNDKEYELVGARVPEIADEDGDVLVEPSSKVRDVEFTSDGTEFGDFEDLGGDTIDFKDVIAWYDGSTDNGASISAQSLAETLTVYGDRAVTNEDDIHGWLNDSSGENVLREELQDRRVRFFTVTRDGDNYTYNLPIVEDVETGEQIRPNNHEDDPSDNDAVREAAAADERSYPEPIADFINSGRDLGLNRDRAGGLLDELVSDNDNALTEEMIEDNGGRDHLVEQVT